MKRYNLIIPAKWADIGSLALLGACQNQEKEPQPPNIIFIMSDDHAYQAISAYGYGLNETPNMDRLAKEGALFTRSTVTNSISAPSRAVLLTGKHSFVNGKVDNEHPFDWNQPNFPKLMQANGYQTAMIGKIHLDGIPQGFDFSMVLPGQGHYYNPDFLINGEKVRKEGYCTEIITETTLDWLKNKRDPNKPFCVLYHQKAPHRNWQPAPKYLNLYDDVTFEPPATFFDNYEGRGRAAKEQEMQGESFRQLVAGKTDQWRDAVYYTYYEYPSVHMVKRHYGVATDRYKLIHFYYDIDEWEMYDQKTDPNEMKNIYDDPEYADVREMLHKRLEELRQQYGDSDELNGKFLKEYLE